MAGIMTVLDEREALVAKHGEQNPQLKEIKDNRLGNLVIGEYGSFPPL